ncbi:hypothetical protein DPMN_148812 [Dreissena polymorpha]|uniref:Zinc finger PHD-type domain-containing protein n=1 Tax=Dreissena polymorpha TaxID=45954 RepID=A0A9D4FAN0_DREPO|nr:hypothetical protein DPMN_148812 [Dreissena polymorpha]
MTQIHDRLKPCRDRKIPKYIQEWKADPVGVNTSDPEQVFCTCRKPWNGRFMIASDYCDEWFHGACVNISPTTLSIDKYKCVKCKEGGPVGHHDVALS